MMTRFLLPMVLAAAAMSAFAEVPRQPRAPGIESRGYIWNERTGEKVEILKLKGDPGTGRVAYEVCQGCHKPNGAGLSDGTYPQLAGQHATVLVKQMADIREGSRDNPKMFPFAGKHIVSTQEIADIAVYLEQLEVPEDNGKGPGTAIDLGRAIFRKECATCHGDKGQGDARKFYPMVAAQHYLYMLRQMEQIKEGNRRNAHPKMVKVIKTHSDAELQALADYMSRLPAPQRARPAVKPAK
jgi:cytochrome c553